MFAIEVRNVTKRYPSGKGVFDLSVEVKEGECFGLVGPNGAGKTTFIEIIEGLRIPDSGASFVFGVSSREERVRSFFGAQIQENVLLSRLRVFEIVEVASSAYRDGFSVSELLEMVGLVTEKRSFYEHLSGGQRQRLRLAMALAGKPRLLFLDEPTTGLDPHSRRAFWELLQSLREKLGMTIFLTSHYMEEVEVLCDRVGLLVDGRFVCVGTPSEVVAKYGNTVFVRIVVDEKSNLTRVQAFASVLEVVEQDEREGVFRIVSREAFLRDLGELMREKEVRLYNIEFDSGSLEDVVVQLTGERR